MLRNRIFACAPVSRNFNLPGVGTGISVSLGATMIGPVGAQVVASSHRDYPVGLSVKTTGRWEDYQAMVDNIAVGGRIAICGQVSVYDRDAPASGPGDIMHIVYRNVRIEEFPINRFAARVPDERERLRPLFRGGRLRFRSDVRSGFDRLPSAFVDLFEGCHEGTLLIRADDV